MTQTALTQLEKWIVKFEETNGTPTMCEVKAQLEMFKEIEKEQMRKSFFYGENFGSKDYKFEDFYKETYTQSSQ